MSTILQEVRLVDLLSDLVQKGAVKVLVKNEVKEIAGFYSRREPLLENSPDHDRMPLPTRGHTAKHMLRLLWS